MVDENAIEADDGVAGKILNARWPAALGLWSIPLPTVIDTILKALAPALPGRIPAAHKGDMGGCSIGGFRPDGRRFLLNALRPNPQVSAITVVLNGVPR